MLYNINKTAFYDYYSMFWLYRYRLPALAYTEQITCNLSVVLTVLRQ